MKLGMFWISDLAGYPAFMISSIQPGTFKLNYFKTNAQII